MHATTPNRIQSITNRALLAGTMLVVGIVATASPTSADSTDLTADSTIHDAHQHAPEGGPRIIHGAIADVVVRVRGGAVCSGTPITGTAYVLTAAHCVLDRDGKAAARTVVRDGVTYTATAVLVDERYFDERTSQLDAAVLVMDQVIPGRSATIATSMPTTGSVTIAGLQPVDSDGSLLRGTGPHNRPSPKGATGNLIEIESVPAGCTVPTASLSIADDQVEIPCGLIPGASGGGMFVQVNETIVLVGIVSTVTADLSANGVVPLDSLHELLRHPRTYWHEVTASHGPGSSAPVVRI